MTSVFRIVLGVLIAVPLTAAITAILLLFPQVVSLVAGIAGVTLLKVAKTFGSKAGVAVGGLLAMGGVLAWALVAANLVPGARTHDGKRLVLDWKDAEANLIFRVTEAPGAFVKQNNRLHVEREGREDVVLIDDDAVFSTIALL
jgi:hypothetical protein